MADSLHDLGFDLGLGDMLPLVTPKAKDTLEGKIRLKKNIVKSARKERKGERRSRGEVKKTATDKKGPAKKAPTKKFPVKDRAKQVAKPAGKPAAKASGKTTGKPTARPNARTSQPRKPRSK
jgi:hypothetical protein